MRFLFLLLCFVALFGGIWAKQHVPPKPRLERINANGVLYIVYTVDPQTDDLRLNWLNPTTGKPYHSFRQLREHLQKRGQKLLFATNSGIFSPQYKPLGLHIEDGKTLVGVNRARSGGNFALLPNGIFWLRGNKAGIQETGDYLKNDPKPTFATQSGPLLVLAGKLHPSFNVRGTSFKIRNGVGVCTDGKVRFVLSAAPVNFHSFAVFFRDTLKCPSALYLDGSISAYATDQTDTQLFDFAGLWSVTRKDK